MLPEEFGLDPKGEKKVWRADFVKNLKELVAKDKAGRLDDGFEQKRSNAYFCKTEAVINAERLMFRTRQNTLVSAKASLAEFQKEVGQTKRDLDVALAAWRDPANKARKETLKARKNELKEKFDALKSKQTIMEKKNAVSERQCEKDVVSLHALNEEARQIDNDQLYGMAVKPAFSPSPELKKAENLKKLSDAEEVAQRKRDMAAAVEAAAIVAAADLQGGVEEQHKRAARVNIDTGAAHSTTSVTPPPPPGDGEQESDDGDSDSDSDSGSEQEEGRVTRNRTGTIGSFGRGIQRSASSDFERRRMAVLASLSLRARLHGEL